MPPRDGVLVRQARVTLRIIDLDDPIAARCCVPVQHVLADSDEILLGLRPSSQYMPKLPGAWTRPAVGQPRLSSMRSSAGGRT